MKNFIYGNIDYMYETFNLEILFFDSWGVLIFDMALRLVS